MKRFLKVFFAGLGILILATVLIGLMLGSSFHSRASETVAAPPSAVHDRVSGLRQWEDEIRRGLQQRDPDVEISVEGPDKGVGSKMTWQGEEFGRGEVVITRADPDRGVWFEAKVDSDDVNVRGSIEYEPQQDGTTKLVTTVDGELPPVVGGYLSALVEQELQKHLERLLERIRQDVE